MEVYGDLQNAPDWLSVEKWDSLYHDRDRNVRTPVTTCFFTVHNLTYLLTQVAQETGRLLNRNNVVVVPTVDMFNWVSQLLRGVPNLVNVADTVNTVNKMIYEHEVGVQYRSLRRRELFFKWFWFKDRPRVIEPPQLEQGRHREVRDSPAGYTLTAPSSRYHKDFLYKQQLAACMQT